MSSNSKPYLDGVLSFPEAETDPLDELFAEATATIRADVSKRKTAKGNERLTEISQAFGELYSKEENWLHRKNVALVHRPTETLLGNFAVLEHRKVKGARRLVRQHELAAVQSVEEVFEDWWIAGNQDPQQRAGWSKVEVISVSNLALPEFGLIAVGTAVQVKRTNTFLSRVELTEMTTFYSPEGKGAMTLPAGTDVLKGLDSATKAKLWKGEAL